MAKAESLDELIGKKAAEFADQRFTERFLTQHRRALQKKDDFLEFIVPDVLKPRKLPERYRGATFDRETAIRRTDAEFLALGHPFADAMLEYTGSYDFAGLTAVRRIAEPKLAGRSGFLFLFVVRQRIAHEGGDECLFEFQPVFVSNDGKVDDDAVAAAVTQTAKDEEPSSKIPEPASSYAVAKQHLEAKRGLWDWSDDVEFLGLSWVEFR
jgi:hypothetical protein